MTLLDIPKMYQIDVLDKYTRIFQYIVKIFIILKTNFKLINRLTCYNIVLESQNQLRIKIQKWLMNKYIWSYTFSEIVAS